MHGRQVIRRDGPALSAQVEAIVFHLEESDAVGLFCERFIQNEDRGLDARIGLEHASRQRDHGNQMLLNEQLAELLVSVLALEDNPFGHDDPCPAVGRQVFGHVIHEQHFASPGLHREAAVRPDAALG